MHESVYTRKASQRPMQSTYQGYKFRNDSDRFVILSTINIYIYNVYIFFSILKTSLCLFVKQITIALFLCNTHFTVLFPPRFKTAH